MLYNCVTCDCDLYDHLVTYVTITHNIISYSLFKSQNNRNENETSNKIEGK